jgi:hypothetical protein
MLKTLRIGLLVDVQASFCHLLRQAKWSLHLDNSEPNQQLQKRWQAWAV